MSNFQHPSEQGQSGAFKGDEAITEAAVLGEIDAKWNNKWNNRKKAAIGYIGTGEGVLPGLE